MNTVKDEGLISFDGCKNRLLDLIKLNIQHFTKGSWNEKNHMWKIVVDKETKGKTILSLRSGSRTFFRFSAPIMDISAKITLLNKLYEQVSKGMMDNQIQNFCEQQVIAEGERKKKNREARKARRKAEKEALKEKEAALLKHLPPVSVA